MSFGQRAHDGHDDLLLNTILQIRSVLTGQTVACVSELA
jgi:hypothetical protein